MAYLDAVADAVESHIGGAVWTAGDGNVLAVLGLNSDGQSPADGSPFIEIEYPVRNERQVSLGSPGNNHFKEEGAFRVVLNERRGIGMQRARTWIDELRTLFRGQRIDPIVCFEATGPVINNSNDLGDYWQMSFVVRYWTYVIG